jgi:hypothetical protein
MLDVQGRLQAICGPVRGGQNEMFVICKVFFTMRFAKK